MKKYEGVAYAVGILATDTLHPIVQSVSIFSNCAGDIAVTSRTRFPFDVASMPAGSYGEAKQLLIDKLFDERWCNGIYAWTIPYLKEQGYAPTPPPPVAPPMECTKKWLRRYPYNYFECVEQDCSNEARYVVAGMSGMPSYCGIHDILLNDGRGTLVSR